METRMRSIAKSVTWRLISIVILVAVSYYVTGDIKETTGITILFQVILAALYYIHERAWSKVLWGRLLHRGSE